MEDNDTIDVYQEQVCFEYSKKTFSISIDLGWWVMLNKKTKKNFLFIILALNSISNEHFVFLFLVVCHFLFVCIYQYIDLSTTIKVIKLMLLLLFFLSKCQKNNYVSFEFYSEDPMCMQKTYVFFLSFFCVYFLFLVSLDFLFIFSFCVCVLMSFVIHELL